MKILVICQHYYPEPFRISDMCASLAARGHDVTVVTGLPDYPEGNIYPGYSNGERTDEIIDNVKVHRCKTLPRKKGALKRFLNYYSFSIASKKYVRSLKEKFDVVLVNQLSPVMMADAAVAYKKKTKTPICLYCLDLWPESLVAGGIKRGSLPYNYYKKVSAKIYRAADKILVTSKSFSDYFSQTFGIDDTIYLPQYAESLFTPESCFKVPGNEIDFMFAGNLGSMQSVDTIIRAAKRVSDMSNVQFHIVGDGSELENLKAFAKTEGVNNVTFYGRRDVSEMPSFYQNADAMLVTMKNDDFISLTLPGKVQSCLAAGKPIIGAIGGEAAEIIIDSECGLCGDAEDDEGLANNIRAFCEIDDKKIFADNAIKYYRQHFTKNKFIDGLISALEETK